MTADRPATPLEWHPWYRDKTWLLDWVQGRNSPVIRIPVTRPLLAAFETDGSPPTLGAGVVTMERRKAAGPAPYVGRPFHYRWWVGVDNLGRQIASDAWIAYLGGLAP